MPQFKEVRFDAVEVGREFFEADQNAVYTKMPAGLFTEESTPVNAYVTDNAEVLEWFEDDTMVVLVDREKGIVP